MKKVQPEKKYKPISNTHAFRHLDEILKELRMIRNIKKLRGGTVVIGADLGSVDGNKSVIVLGKIKKGIITITEVKEFEVSK